MLRTVIVSSFLASMLLASGKQDAPKKLWLVKGPTPKVAVKDYMGSFAKLTDGLKKQFFKRIGGTAKTEKAQLEEARSYFARSCKRIELRKGKTTIQKVDVHKDLAEDLVRALNKALQSGYVPKKVEGIAVRGQRGKSTLLSEHALGRAVDLERTINVRRPRVNGKTIRRKAKSSEAAYKALKKNPGSHFAIRWSTVKILLDAGFRWGGFFTKSDPMHFQK